MQTALLVLYCICSVILFLYGANCYVMLALHARGRRRQPKAIPPQHWPSVTVQLPVYNERLVVEDLLRAVGELDYPRDLLEVQVLDDSTDETTAIVEREVDRLRAEGLIVSLLHRQHRAGYKAGALAEGLKQASGEFLAIFDADFLPPPDFLRRTLAPFSDPRVGAVQARWGHRNEEENLLTRLQAIGVDAHFTIEQGARAWNGLFMNFNGTAGVWRRAAIEDAGGWSARTLTEDLDLSYRAQLRGWRIVFLEDLVVPGELPAEVGALRTQQFRWAKGSIQTAVLILPAVLRSRATFGAKAEALLHLTHYAVHPMIIACSVLAVPALHWAAWTLPPPAWNALVALVLASSFAPSALYATSQRLLHADWRQRLWRLPLLFGLGVSLAVNNSRAVVGALFGRTGEFVRTPKFGDRRPGEARPAGVYWTAGSPWVLVELAMGVYCLGGAWSYATQRHPVVAAILGAYGLSFGAIACASLMEGLRRRRVVQPAVAEAELSEVAS